MVVVVALVLVVPAGRPLVHGAVGDEHLRDEDVLQRVDPAAVVAEAPPGLAAYSHDSIRATSRFRNSSHPNATALCSAITRPKARLSQGCANTSSPLLRGGAAGPSRSS